MQYYAEQLILFSKLSASTTPLFYQAPMVPLPPNGRLNHHDPETDTEDADTSTDAGTDAGTETDGGSETDEEPTIRAPPTVAGSVGSGASDGGSETDEEPSIRAPPPPGNVSLKFYERALID